MLTSLNRKYNLAEYLFTVKDTKQRQISLAIKTQTNMASGEVDNEKLNV